MSDRPSEGIESAARNPSRAGSLHLIGGALCLDFANTASGRGTEQAQEHLRSYRDLLDWSVHAGSLPTSSAKRLHRSSAGAPAAAGGVLKRAIALREATRHAVLSIASAGPVAALDIATIKREAAAAITAAELGVALGHGRWGWPNDTSDLARPLWPVARSAMAILDNADPDRLKLCPGHDCGWIFLDRSKNNSRRWCDMAVCGNRAKARRYYRRSGA